MKDFKAAVKKFIPLGILIAALIFFITWCYKGGELIDREFRPDYMEEVNPIRREEAIERYNVISGIITEMKPGGRNHWDLTIESEGSGFKWITVYTTKDYARNVNIGDFVTVRGDFHYHRSNELRGEIYESLSVGECVAGPPLTFHAQIISYENYS